MACTGSLSEGPAVLRSPSKSLKVFDSLMELLQQIDLFFPSLSNLFQFFFILYFENFFNSLSLANSVRQVFGGLIKHVFAHIMQMAASPRYASIERRGVVPGELLLNKIEEVNKSVKVYVFFFFPLFLFFLSGVSL